MCKPLYSNQYNRQAIKMIEKDKIVYTPPDDIITEKQNAQNEKSYVINEDILKKEIENMLNIISQAIFSLFSEKNILITRYYAMVLKDIFKGELNDFSFDVCAVCKAPHKNNYITATIAGDTYYFCSKRCMRQGFANFVSKLV
jgi:hypothetical protein